MADALEYDRLARALEEVLACLPTRGVDASGLPTKRARKLVREIRQVVRRLRELAHAIDPVLQPPTTLDPYQPDVLGRLIGETMQEQPRHPLASLRDFYGSGVYALYYRGDHPAYGALRHTNTPIYAGKADPPTPLAATPEDQGLRLSRRLREHAKSIRAALNLSIDDFDYRFLVVKSGLQKAAEDYLLNYFRPIWNQRACSGFGKHGDDPRIRSNTRSEWDTLHPGREWASRAGNTPNPKTHEQIIADIAAHFAQTPPRE